MWYKIKNIYVRSTKVRPVRTLFDETIISQSTSWSSGVIASRNWTIIRPSFSFWWGNGNYSITTQDGFDIISTNQNHWNCDIWMSQSTYNSLKSSYSKIKVVCDYFNIWTAPSRYTNVVEFGNDEWINATSAGIVKLSKWSWLNMALDTPYSLEQIIDTATLNTSTTIKNLSTNATQTISYTKVFGKETNSSYQINWWWPRWIKVVRDAYGWPAVCSNIHIYVK